MSTNKMLQQLNSITKTVPGTALGSKNIEENNSQSLDRAVAPKAQFDTTENARFSTVKPKSSPSEAQRNIHKGTIPSHGPQNPLSPNAQRKHTTLNEHDADAQPR